MLDGRQPGAHTGGVNGRRAWFVLAGIALAIAAGLLLLPTGSSQSCTAENGSPVVCTEASTSLLSTQGPGVILVLAVPAILCLVPALLPGRGSMGSSTAVLFLFCFVAGLSVGLFYLPVAVAALTLTLRSARPEASLGSPKAAAS